MTSLTLTIYAKPQPQGSIRAFMPKGAKHPVLTSDNKNLRPYRQIVSQEAVAATEGQQRPIFGKHQPVTMEVDFYFRKPDSVGKKRFSHVVKPDLSKLVRSVEDSLTGIAYHDDAQIVGCYSTKNYDQVERTVVTIRAVE